jgi:hypothetical protein
MTDSEILWKFISREFPDDHVVIYLYVCGNVRSPKTAMDKAMVILEKIFCPPYDRNYVQSILKGFLDRKKEQYKKGLVKVKPIY